MGDVSRSSITLSSASYASSLFPAVDEASASLIEAILSRVSPTESEWKPFLQAYDEVFNERGLDRQSDTVIYDLILKLGLQAGKNWRAKWENVKRTQQHELLLQREGAQRVDQGAARNDNIRTPINKKGNSYTVSEEWLHSHGYEDDGQPRLTREALDKLQHAASPYKAVQTPYAPQTRINVRDGTTPRVHFAHEGHQHHSHAHSDVFRTPDLSTPSHTAEEREAMLRQAVQMDRINLLGRMYDDWISRLFVLKRLDMHTSLARDALLKRRSLTFWHERVKRHQELEERVDSAYEATLKSSCLRLWQQKKEKKQKTEWEKRISIAFRTITKKKEKQIEEAAFGAWREASLDSRAFKFDRNCLLRHSLGKWVSNAARHAELHSEATALQASHDEILIVDTFARWKEKTILLVRESEIVENAQHRLLNHALQIWQIQLQHVQIADNFASRESQRSAFNIWKNRKLRNDAMEMQAKSLSKARDEDTMERAFHTWRIREHSRLLEQAKTIRLARAAMERWKERYAAITGDLEIQATAFHRRVNSSLTRRFLSSWVKKTNQHHKALRLATSLNNRLLLQRTFADWKDELSNRRMEYRKAEIASTFFSQRNALRTWYKRMRWVKASKVMASKETDFTRDYFRSWREKTRTSQRFAILEEGISAAIDQRIMSNALTSWTTRVIELRARAISVTQTRENQIIRNCLTHWLSKSRQNVENLSLVDSFVEIQEEEMLRGKFRKWLSSTRRKIKLRVLLEEKLENDDRNLVSGVFDRWFDVYKERQLIDKEMDIVRYRTYQNLGLALQKWKTRTITLPAIQFDAHRQRKRFFSIWGDRLPERMDQNHAIEHDRLRLSRVTLAIWQERAREKAARRASNRFRAFAARSPLPPSSLTSYNLPVPTSALIGPTYPASAPRLHIVEPSSQIATPSGQRVPRKGTAVSYSPLTARGGIPASTSMPLIYSASRLRKEVGTPPRRSTASTGVTPLPTARMRSAQGGREALTPAAMTGSSRRGSNLDPESIALPPSSSATGPSSTSSSPLAHQSALPPIHVNPSSSLLINARQQQQEEDRKDKKHDRRKSRSRDAFEEGVLKEMRERLAAAGLGDGLKSKN